MRRLRHLFQVLVFSLAGYSVQAGCNDWETLHGYKNVYMRDVARDRFGNLYAVGSFQNPNFIIGATVIPLYGAVSLFILKFNKNLSLEWARSVGGGSQEYADNVVVDKDDNIVVAGYFYSPTIKFDCIQLNNSGRSEMFVVKYSSQGYAMWAVDTAHLNDGFYSNLAITGSNDIIVTSSFVAGSVSFAGHPVQGFGGYDSFVASLGSAGNLNWIRSFGGAGSINPDYIAGLDVDSKDNVLITGFFESPSLVFDGFTVNGFTISENYFVAKLNKLGNTVWAKGGQTPVDQSGFDVVADKNDNVIVAGRFYGSQTQFGNITLISQGNTDVLIVKYDPAGNVLNAKRFGGTEFDSATNLSLDGNGNVIVAGYYYSYTFVVDGFTVTKPEFQADSFIVTFDNSLTAQCFKRVSGTGENILMALHTDQANNIWLITQDVLMLGLSQFDGVFSVNSSDFTSMVVSIGNNQSFDVSPPPVNSALSVNLGNDIMKCQNEKILLDAGLWCDAIYLWNDGSKGRFLATTQQGLFWAEVQVNGKIGRDSIIVSNAPSFKPNLGADKTICHGITIALNATQSQNVTYTWDNGSTLATRSVNATGVYWVKVVSHCQTAYDTIAITVVPPLIFDLGENKTICSSEPSVIGTEMVGDLHYRWQDGSNTPKITVTISGKYILQVSNECESVSDSITITFIDLKKITIPNVITPNGDTKNDKLVLPEVLGGSSVEVFNRWGTQVYQSLNYENNWSAEGISAGVYFYTIKGPCLDPGFKGFLQVVK